MVILLFIFAIIQGFTEITPIGGHGLVLILSSIFHIPFSDAINFVLWGNLGIGIMLILIYLDEWKEELRILKKIADKIDLLPEEKHSFAYVISFLIVGFILTFLFQFFTNTVATIPLLIPALFVISGFILYLSEWVYTLYSTKKDNLHPYQGMVIALFMAIGVIPGLNVLGMGLSASLVQGKNRLLLIDNLLMFAGPIYIFNSIFMISQLRFEVGSIVYALISAISAYIFMKFVKRAMESNTRLFTYILWAIGLTSIFLIKFIL